MAYLEPSVEVTGGPWYTDSEFDSAFVSILLDQFYNYIAARVRRLNASFKAWTSDIPYL